MNNMASIINLCKNRGFIFNGSELYGGLANSWDYGPLGSMLKNNIKNSWKKFFVQENIYNVEIDSSILMNPKVWEASGHVSGFNDPLIDCKKCKCRYRADDLLDNSKKFTILEINELIINSKLTCPNCNNSDFTKIRQFNLMFQTSMGVIDDSKSQIFLRPETAQGIFINFKNVHRTIRKNLPFGIAQIGKSFRNEITPGNFIFRTREFEQMELEFFCEPGTDFKWFNFWKKQCADFLIKCGISKKNIRFRDHLQDELSHYSLATTDIEFLFPFGWGELLGISNRGNYDLTQHLIYSKQKSMLEYYDSIKNISYIPYVIEPSIGVERLLLAILINSYQNESFELNKNRNILKINYNLAPYICSVLPISKKLTEDALPIFYMLNKFFNVDFDNTGTIGKRYRRNDEIGTPFCITYDFDSLNDKKITIRDRDTMKQVRIDISNIVEYINSHKE